MTQLTNRTYPMLKIFAVEHGSGYYMSVEVAQQFDQRPFRSMLIHGWIAYSRGHGFYITKEGRKAWEEFLHTGIERLDPSRPLTKYFDAKHHGVHFRRLHAVGAA